MRVCIALIFLTLFITLSDCDDDGKMTADPFCSNYFSETGEAYVGSDFGGITCTSFG